jgi:ribosome biogenesis GTPase
VHKQLTGQITFGINNIYSVQTGEGVLSCRIKGKVLRTEKKYYNPIAVGDYVDLEPDPLSSSTGWIVSRRERSTVFSRYNKKRKASQVIAANADLLVGIGSTASPPFRPRFLDRLLVSAELGGLEAVLVINKHDLGLNAETAARLDAYRVLGYRVLETSALDGKGISELEELICGRLAVFAGQSGVGKSTLLNRIDPGLGLKVGEISQKYDRGAHTTNFAVMVRTRAGLTCIDTPGVREFEIDAIRPEELPHYFREFRALAPSCAYSSCLHRDEPGCAVLAAVEAGSIHPDRHDSYLRIYETLRRLEKELYGRPLA